MQVIQTQNFIELKKLRFHFLFVSIYIYKVSTQMQNSLHIFALFTNTNNLKQFFFQVQDWDLKIQGWPSHQKHNFFQLLGIFISSKIIMLNKLRKYLLSKFLMLLCPVQHTISLFLVIRLSKQIKHRLNDLYSLKNIQNTLLHHKIT